MTNGWTLIFLSCFWPIMIFAHTPPAHELQSLLHAQHAYLKAAQQSWEMQQVPTRSVHTSPQQAWDQLTGLYAGMQGQMGQWPLKWQESVRHIQALHIRFHDAFEAQNWQRQQVLLNDIDASQGQMMYDFHWQSDLDKVPTACSALLEVLQHTDHLLQHARIDARGLFHKDWEALGRSLGQMRTRQIELLQSVPAYQANDRRVLQTWVQLLTQLEAFWQAGETYVSNQTVPTPFSPKHRAYVSYTHHLLPLYTDAADGIMPLTCAFFELAGHTCPLRKLPTPWFLPPPTLEHSKPLTTHYLMVLDASPSMKKSGMLALFQQQFAAIPQSLEPTAMISLIPALEYAYPILESIPVAQAADRTTWPQRWPRQDQALIEVLQKGFQVLEQTGNTTQLILVTDGHQGTPTQLLQLIDQEGLQGRSLSVAWMGPSDTDAYQVWESLIESCHGTIVPITAQNMRSVWHSFR